MLLLLASTCSSLNDEGNSSTKLCCFKVHKYLDSDTCGFSTRRTSTYSHINDIKTCLTKIITIPEITMKTHDELSSWQMIAAPLPYDFKTISFTRQNILESEKTLKTGQPWRRIELIRKLFWACSTNSKLYKYKQEQLLPERSLQSEIIKKISLQGSAATTVADRGASFSSALSPNEDPRHTNK
jgi:hypothetical protein